jgi:hypothetical protein
MVVSGPSLPVQPHQVPQGGQTQRPPNVEREVAPQEVNVSEGSLWEVLTEEEREFFAQQVELGPLTYGPNSSKLNRADAPIGQRIDVRA